MEVHLFKRHGGFVAADVDPQVLDVANELANPTILESPDSESEE